MPEKYSAVTKNDTNEKVENIMYWEYAKLNDYQGDHSFPKSISHDFSMTKK